MAWNEPGQHNQENDPWNGGRKQSGPPDLDEIFKKLHKQLRGFFRGRKGGDNQGGQFSAAGKSLGLGLIVAVFFVLWGLSGIFIVSPAEEAAVLRFGKFQAIAGPGPHWIPRFIESQRTLDIQKVSNFPYQALMLTKDENIVSVAIAVQYRINNLRDYFFNTVDSYESLQQATASALRQVIGHTTLDEALTTGREKVRQQVFDLLTEILSIYKAGLVVTDVTVQPAKAPDEVKDAFDDAIKAQEDEQRFINQAQAYARGVEPIAKGRAQRLIQDATAYEQEIILAAQGDTARYLSILPQYLHAPLVTRQRMYLDTVQSVLSNTSKILIDTNAGNMMYLPLDKIMQSNLALTPTSESDVSSYLQDSPSTNVPLRSSNSNRTLYRQRRS